ncbi:DUF1194 domain-containing protein [Seohaeicola saemankumensis]|uniref:DUF1194 domain-containing protein n=1 Tax=Seohaeicola TaxID=481178 RepID=UPI0035CF72BC|nr:DUF1194 domain-containing protein [Paracoccaceae bacterium]
MAGPLALRGILAAGLALAGAGGATAQEPCRLALVLAMDISSSVDPLEDALQRGGLAQALRAPEVVEAILSQPDRPVALAMFEWSGRVQQDMVLPWVMLRDAATIGAVADRIAFSRRSYAEFSTAIGHAIEYAHDLFRQGPACDARVLDISGDGVNNDGFGPTAAYDAFDFSQITVNALVIEVQEAGTDHGITEGADTGLADYFRQIVIRGPGSFVEVAAGFEDFERAMRRKLLRELEVRIGLLSR